METAELTEPQSSSDANPQERLQAPPGAGTLATWLFTAGLTIAFAWLLVGYAYARRGSGVPAPAVPVWFWFSTFALLVSSVTLHWSYLSAKMGRVAVAGAALRLTTVLAIVFLALQTPGLVKLVQAHRQAEADSGTAYLLVLALVAVHGAHVLGGLVRIMVLNTPRHVRAADAHGAAHLKQMCLFWHFLAVAWVVMFGLILWA